MNRLPSSRFSRALHSGLFLLSLFAIIYSCKDVTAPVLAESDPPAGSARTNGNSAALAREPREANGVDAVAKVNSPEMPMEHAKASIDEVKPSALLTEKSLSTPIPDAKTDVMDFRATAYCLKGLTASGVSTRPGVIAADPRVLPLGTVVHITAGRYTGTYTVLDTGAKIKGQLVDIYMPGHREARQFGRQKIKLKVLSRGGRRGSSRQSGAFTASP
jgi:3D (Asp-Asp-Asp) domain-containing protein